MDPVFTHCVDYDVFCVACGGAFHGHDEIDWWESVLVRAPPTHECEASTSCRERHDGGGRPLELIHASRTEGGPEMFHDPTKSQTQTQYYSVCDAFMDYPYIPLHPKCLEIATRVVDYKRNVFGALSGSGATSLGGIYEIYRKRCMLQSMARGPFPTVPPFIILHEPHNYYGADDGHPGGRWNTHASNLLQYEACPFPLVGITEQILSFLEPFPEDVPSDHSLALCEMFARLPAEIVDVIISLLHPFENPPLTVTRILPPSIWRAILFSGKLLPWLWDLSPVSLKTRRSDNACPYDTDEIWDWELLVRQLAQVEIFSHGNVMAKIQLGLRNRRRIWRLIDEARMNDSLQVLDIPGSDKGVW